MMRRHELDPVSLIFGFAFAGLGLLFLVGRADQALRLRWIWPLLLFALGAGILLDLARPGRRSHPDPEPDPNPELNPDPELNPEPEPDSDPEPNPDPEPDSEPEPDPGAGPGVDNREHPI